jgi:KipI family sensor histidine kinase inhibitor
MKGSVWFLAILIQRSLVPITEMRPKPTFFDCAESGLLVAFEPEQERDLSLSILRIAERLDASMLPGLKESIPALSSLTVMYDPLALPKQRLALEIERLCASPEAASEPSRLWMVPAVYGGAVGPDLEHVAKVAGLDEDAVIALHAGRIYEVAMLGFLPGFAYLRELPASLRIPRRATPRARVPAGSVAIAADMTAIYPLESPGGWHLVGSTPFPPWDMARFDKPYLRAGDRVQFRPVGAEEAEEFRRRLAEGFIPEAAEVA